jgi:pyruvate/2-oxoglutarate dehydrogenase complex dihydrolipoamide acyltransferase (E2) component
MTTTATDAVEVKVPDIGDFSDVPVIEIHVAEGDTVAAEDPLITLESDKATMDVPSPAEGVVQRLAVSVGDQVSEGTLILTLAAGDGSAAQPALDERQQAADVQQQEPAPEAVSEAAAAAEASAAGAPTAAPSAPAPGPAAGDGHAHAGPSVRRLARELDIDLSAIRGTGEKGRITKEDLLATLKGPAAPAAAAATSTSGTAPCRTIDQRPEASKSRRSTTVEGVPGSGPPSMTRSARARIEAGTSSRTRASAPPARFADDCSTGRPTGARNGTRTPSVEGSPAHASGKRPSGFGSSRVTPPGSRRSTSARVRGPDAGSPSRPKNMTAAGFAGGRPLSS